MVLKVDLKLTPITHTHTHTHTAACVSFRCYDIEIAKLTDTCDYNVHYYARVKLNIPKFVGTVRIDEASFEPVIDGISLGFSSVRPRITYMDQESGTNRTSTEIQSGPSVLEIESKLQVKRQSWINVWLTRHPKRVVTSFFTMYLIAPLSLLTPSYSPTCTPLSSVSLSFSLHTQVTSTWALGRSASAIMNQRELIVRVNVVVRSGDESR